MKRICQECKCEFEGRVDKKFCCDQCRNTYNNRQNRDIINYSRNINRILKNNRRILNEFFEKNVYKTHRDKLIAAGFIFDYMTNIYRTKTGKVYFFCYDLGYLVHDDGICTIVEKMDYVD
jgi:hypothetical protein